MVHVVKAWSPAHIATERWDLQVPEPKERKSVHCRCPKRGDGSVDRTPLFFFPSWLSSGE